MSHPDSPRYVPPHIGRLDGLNAAAVAALAVSRRSRVLARGRIVLAQSRARCGLDAAMRGIVLPEDRVRRGMDGAFHGGAGAAEVSRDNDAAIASPIAAISPTMTVMAFGTAFPFNVCLASIARLFVVACFGCSCKPLRRD